MSDHSKTVLIVEDDMILTMVLERMVEKLGHQVRGTAVTGEGAIREARETLPDLILMDVQLKDDIDGIDAMLRIREHSQAPVIYITGNSDQGNLERAEMTDFAEYMIKPIRTEEFKKAIEKALSGN